MICNDIVAPLFAERKQIALLSVAVANFNMIASFATMKIASITERVRMR